ncbi:MAG: hypothetical protein M1838_003333, partial [Thelocarpon superellum]
YNELKNALSRQHAHRPASTDTRPQLSSLEYLGASGIAGALTAILTNPIWVIKTRMLATGRASPGAYSSLGDGVRTILRTEGIAGFYRGLVPALFGVSHGAVQFMAYEQLKNWRAGDFHRRDAPHAPLDHHYHHKLTNWDYLALSAAAKVLAGSVTYPYQVVRARLQTYDAHKTYTSTADAVRRIWRREGIRGFYKG